jgi:hypothetical protein
MDNKMLDWRFGSLEKAFGTIVDELKVWQTQANEAIKLSQEGFGKIRPLIPYTSKLANIYMSDEKPKILSGRVKASDLLARVAEAREEYQTISKQNDEIIAHNRKIRDSVESTLIAIGLPKRVWQQKKRSHKTELVDAPWIGEVGKWFPAYDNRHSIFEGLVSLEASIKKIEEERLKIEVDKQKEKEQQEKKRVEDLEFVSLLNDAGLPLSTSKGDLFDHVINLDKYVRLSHYLRKNREDWSEGPDYAKMGIGSFKVETTRDQEIHDEIWSYINDWDGDGRIFRDCEWNYDAIFELADKKAAEMYNRAANICDDGYA